MRVRERAQALQSLGNTPDRRPIIPSPTPMRRSDDRGTVTGRSPGGRTIARRAIAWRTPRDGWPDRWWAPPRWPLTSRRAQAGGTPEARRPLPRRSNIGLRRAAARWPRARRAVAGLRAGWQLRGHRRPGGKIADGWPARRQRPYGGTTRRQLHRSRGAAVSWKCTNLRSPAGTLHSTSRGQNRPLNGARPPAGTQRRPRSVRSDPRARGLAARARCETRSLPNLLAKGMISLEREPDEIFRSDSRRHGNGNNYRKSSANPRRKALRREQRSRGLPSLLQKLNAY